MRAGRSCSIVSEPWTISTCWTDSTFSMDLLDGILRCGKLWLSPFAARHLHSKLCRCLVLQQLHALILSCSPYCCRMSSLHGTIQHMLKSHVPCAVPHQSACPLCPGVPCSLHVQHANPSHRRGAGNFRQARLYHLQCWRLPSQSLHLLHVVVNIC